MLVGLSKRYEKSAVSLNHFQVAFSTKSDSHGRIIFSQSQGYTLSNLWCLPFTKTIQLEISGINMKQSNAMLRETESL